MTAKAIATAMTKNVHVVVMNNLIEEIRIFGRENHVPIILDEGLKVLLDTIKKENIKSVLEVGTAIGYSAINMASLGVSVTTIERDKNMIGIATNNIKRANLEDKIKIIECDAKEALPLIQDQKYDLIFIDAAKGSYRKFFDDFKTLLNDDGIIICDNMEFHGLVMQDDLSNCSRQLRQMIKKLRDFRQYLESSSEFKTIFINVGDGLTISKKK